MRNLKLIKSLKLQRWNVENLKKSYNFAVSAMKCWKTLSERGSVYHFNLEFRVGGIGRSGHWKDRPPELEKDVAKLKSLLDEKGIDPAIDEVLVQYDCGTLTDDLSCFVSDVLEYCTTCNDLIINVEVGELNRLSGSLKMHFRHITNTITKKCWLAMEFKEFE